MLEIKFLVLGDVSKNTTFVDVSMEILYHKQYNIEFNIDSFYIKNSLHTEVKLIEEYENTILFYCESRISIISNISDIPFNNQFLLLDLSHIDFDIIINESRIPQINSNDFKHRENIFVWKYGKQRNNSSILKYMFIPFFLTLLLQLTHSIKGNNDKSEENFNSYIDAHGSWIGIAATFLLADVALFFTVPDSTRLTNIERFLFINFFMKIFVTMFAFYDWDNKIGDGIDENNGHHDIDYCITAILLIIMTCYSYVFYERGCEKTIHSTLDYCSSYSE